MKKHSRSWMQRRGITMAEPHSAHARQRRERENAMVKLDGGGIFKEISPPFALPLVQILGGNPLTTHQGKRVIRSTGVHPRDVGAGNGGDADETGERMHRSMQTLCGINQRLAGAGSLTRRRGIYHVQSRPEHARINRESSSQVRRETIRTHSRDVVGKFLLLQTAFHHPPTNHPLRRAEHEKHAQALRQR